MGPSPEKAEKSCVRIDLLVGHPERKVVAGEIVSPAGESAVNLPPTEKDLGLGPRITWPKYAAWRRNKCPSEDMRAPIWLDELDQAIHELSGEIAELSDLVNRGGPHLLASDARGLATREAIMDEVGDVIFTACWVSDCLDRKFLDALESPLKDGFLSPELRKKVTAPYDSVAQYFSEHDHVPDFSGLPESVRSDFFAFLAELQAGLLDMHIGVGLISNSFKKLRWQRREPQGEPGPGELLFYILVGLDSLCALLGISLEAAALTNQVKLNRRYPNGWVTGGGIRQ